MLNWCKPLVEQFTGSPLCKGPSNLSEFFERKVEHVRDFDNRISNLPIKEAQQAFQEMFLLGLAETRVGLYSKYHDVAVYRVGYGSQEAIHLAYMLFVFSLFEYIANIQFRFTTCLDASKTGLRVKLDEFNKDSQKWGAKKPWYEWKLEQGRSGKNATQKDLIRRGTPPFILDVLVVEGEKLKEDFLKKYKRLKAQSGERDKDKDLSKPWNAAMTKAAQAKSQGISGFSENLEDIKNHVLQVLVEYEKAGVPVVCTNAREEATTRNMAYDKVASFFSRPPKFRGFVFFSDEDVQTLKASFASTKSLTFAFSVAFHDLCAIKARAAGDIPITRQFAQCITIPSIVTRMLSQVQLGDTDY